MDPRVCRPGIGVACRRLHKRAVPDAGKTGDRTIGGVRVDRVVIDRSHIARAVTGCVPRDRGQLPGLSVRIRSLRRQSLRSRESELHRAVPDTCTVRGPPDLQLGSGGLARVAEADNLGRHILIGQVRVVYVKGWVDRHRERCGREPSDPVCAHAQGQAMTRDDPSCLRCRSRVQGSTARTERRLLLSG